MKRVDIILGLTPNDLHQKFRKDMEDHIDNSELLYSREDMRKIWIQGCIYAATRMLELEKERKESHTVEEKIKKARRHLGDD
jgi:hypothetical protein